jgi:hypothetical protein
VQGVGGSEWSERSGEQDSLGVTVRFSDQVDALVHSGTDVLENSLVCFDCYIAIETALPTAPRKRGSHLRDSELRDNDIVSAL